jgi:hypothetical protein
LGFATVQAGVTGFPLWQAWSNPRSGHAGFVMDKMVLRLVFFINISLAPANFHFTNCSLLINS